MIIIWIFLVLLPSFVHSKGRNEICFATSSKFLHDVRAEIPFSWEIWYSIELLSVTSVVELEGTRGSRIENKYGKALRYLGNPGKTRRQERVIWVVGYIQHLKALLASSSGIRLWVSTVQCRVPDQNRQTKVLCWWEDNAGLEVRNNSDMGLAKLPCLEPAVIM